MTFQEAFQFITHHGFAHTFWCAGEDQVADVDAEKLRDMRDDVIKPKDHLGRVAFLHLFAVFVQGEIDVVLIVDSRKRLPLENVLVVVDDLALPLEKIRIRGGGSDAGHNGLKSIQAVLGTTDYPKLRFGIGNNYPRGRQADFVLGKWRGDEEALVKKKIDVSVEAIESFATEGLNAAMNKFNNLEIRLEK